MDERPLKLLARAPDAVRPRLLDLADLAGRAAAEADTDLQFEFGRDHVAFIVGCNQFLRLHFRGDHAGIVEVPPAAGIDGAPALGRVFQMFGWQSAAAADVPSTAVEAAFRDAAGKGAPKL